MTNMSFDPQPDGPSNVSTVVSFLIFLGGGATFLACTVVGALTIIGWFL